MRCPHCQFENREGVHFCEECGEKLIMASPSLCPSCGFENREGVKFCEECGTKLAAETAESPKKKSTRKKTQPEPQPKEETVPGLCAACGFQNREGMRFCEECGEVLSGESPAEPRKKPARKKTQPKSEAIVERSSPPEPVPQTPPQTVVVQVQQEEKRRFNPLWLALLLLLLVISCGCLMMYDVVVPPASVAAAVDPMLEAVRMRISAGIDRAIGGVADAINGGQNGGVAVAGNDGGKANQPAGGAAAGDEVCDQLATHYNAGELRSWVRCAEDANEPMPEDECEIDVDMWDIMDDDLDQLPMDEIRDKGFEVVYRWKNGKSGVVEITDTCTVLNWCIRIPRDPNSDRLDYTISFDGCEIGKEYSDGRLIEEEAPPPAEPKCCPIISFANIHYDAGLLYFDIVCDGGRLADQIAGGTVYDGADNFWANMECKTVNNDRFSFLECKSLSAVSVKSGNVRIEMEYEGEEGGICRIADADASFPPPPMCPSGQSLCAGSCCSEGHCCTCNGKLGCWQSCSGCD